MVDVIYEVVGGEIFEKVEYCGFFSKIFLCLRCVGDEGRLLVVGFASGMCEYVILNWFLEGKIPSVPANIPLIKGFSVVGVRSGESMRLHPEKAAVNLILKKLFF